LIGTGRTTLENHEKSNQTIEVYDASSGRVEGLSAVVIDYVWEVRLWNALQFRSA
jgi:hypothetical protein